MAGTRTAPTVDGTPDYKLVALTWFDWTGDQRTDSYQFDADSTNAEIEAFAAAMQACSNATLWRIGVSDTYNSDGDSGNAVEAVWENVKDNIVFLLKDVLNNSMDIFVPSPLNTLFLENSETIDPASQPIINLLASVLPMKANYAVKSGRFTHRKQIGKKVNI